MIGNQTRCYNTCEIFAIKKYPGDRAGGLTKGVTCCEFYFGEFEKIGEVFRPLRDQGNESTLEAPEGIQNIAHLG